MSPSDSSHSASLPSDSVSQRFAGFYDLHAQAIYAYFHYRTRNRALSEDLTSQTFLKALEKFESFDAEKGGFAPWIYRIARNTLVDHYRSSKATSDLETAFELASDDDVNEETVRTESRERVQKALASLSEAQREVVILRMWDELSFKDIARFLEKTEAGVKMAFYRALQDVQKQLALLTLVLAYLLSLSFNTLIYG